MNDIDKLTEQIARLEHDARMAVGSRERVALVQPAVSYARLAARLGEDELRWRALSVAAACEPLRRVA